MATRENKTIQLFSHDYALRTCSGQGHQRRQQQHRASMAKSKKCVHIVNSIFLYEGLHQTFSHTNHNQNKKAHRNGIKKPKSAGRTRSLKGVRFTP